MKIDRIIVDGLKGLSLNVPITAKNVLFSGPMGSGKSAMLEGVHLALDLPTRYGSTGLDELSPTGEWTVRLDLGAAGAVRRLERFVRRRGSGYAVNGSKVDRDEYLKAIGTVLTVDPYHVSLGEFVRLSGQKRATLFASMLESDPVCLVDVIAQAERSSLEDWLKGLVDLPDQILARDPWLSLKDLTARPAEMVEAIRDAVNGSLSSERDAKISLEALMTRNAAGSAGFAMTPAEARAGIQKIDEQLGGLKARRDAFAVEKERYESAKKVLASSEQQLETDRKALEEAKASAATVDFCQKTVNDLIALSDKSGKALKARDAEIEQHQGSFRAIAVEVAKLEQARQSVDEIMAQNWEVDDAWLANEAETLFLAIGADASVIAIKANKPAMVKFVQEVVAEVLGGNHEKVSAKIAEAQKQRSAAEEQLANARTLRGQESAAAIADTEACSGAMVKLKAAIAAREKVSDINAKVTDWETKLIQMRQNIEKSSPRELDAGLEAQIKQLTDERGRLDKIVKELESLLSISGQVEQQRVLVAEAAQITGSLKKLMEIVQRWRDELIRQKIAAVLGPFSQRFALLFGPQAVFSHHSAGEGRTTEFYFTVSRPPRGMPVRIESLSDGETVLAAAAFLSALQSIKSGPGSLLTLNSEGLDATGLLMLIANGPELGVDHLLIANNRVDGNHRESAEKLGWQIVDMVKS